MNEPMSDERLEEIEMTWRWPGSTKEWRDDIRDLLAEVRRLRTGETVTDARTRIHDHAWADPCTEACPAHFPPLNGTTWRTE